MAQQIEKGSSTGASTHETADPYADLKPKRVDSEDSMSADKVKLCWEKMYRYAGLRTPTEKQRKAFRLAVYVYGCKNGTTRVGNYQGEMVLADGTVVPASVITRAVGRMNIRRFFRGNMEDSYQLLKGSKVMEDDERYIAMAESMGIQAEVAFARADWFRGCPYFTPAEEAAYEKSFNYAIERAKRARGGHTLEQVEDANLEAGLKTQGRLDAGEEVLL